MGFAKKQRVKNALFFSLYPSCKFTASIKILQQPLDIFEFKLRTESLTEAASQFLENAARALRVDLARHLDGDVIAIVATAQRTAERVGLLLGTRLTVAPGPATGLALALPHALLLHLLCEVLRPTAQRL